jgi:ADP-ribose pyrophosphatase YjhB (NUDIX family)
VDRRRVDCVGALVHDGLGRLLLVKRGQEPALGRWSVPGGRVEPGESDQAAVVREAWEETGLRVRPERLVGVVERDGPDGPDGVVYVIRDYACALAADASAAAARAASDAADLCWCPVDEVHLLDCTPGLVDALREWGVLP